MKLSKRLSLCAGIIAVVSLAGCGKSEPAAPVSPAESAPAAKVEVGVSMDQTLKVAESVAKAVGVELKIPNFKTASVAELSTVAIQSLSGLQDAAKSSPAVVQEIGVAKSALSAGDALGALKSLSSLNDAVKRIPGASGLLDTSKQLVSAWALKQGFDTSKISGVLGALQSGDLGQIAAQSLPLLSKGGISSEQSGLLKGVLNTFGIDSGAAAGAAGAVKGLFGK